MEQTRFTPLEQAEGQPKKSIIKIVFTIIGIIVLSLVALGVVASFVVRSSLDDARDRAREAAVMQSMRSVIPPIILCGDTAPNIKISPPTNGGLICVNETFTWPELASYKAIWDGCDFNVQYDEEGYVDDFQFCATTEKGTVHLCTAEGCFVR